MDQDEDLPIAVPMPLAAVLDLDDDEEGEIADARLLPRNFLLNGREMAEVSTSFLYGMIQDQDSSCTAVSGWAQQRGCNRIVERITEVPDDVYYKAQRTGRTPLHEACLRCSCLHIIGSILAVDTHQSMVIDNAGNTALHLLLVGISTHALEPDSMGKIIDELLAPSPPLIASICNAEGSTALHMACAASETMVHLDSFQKILRANPSCAFRANNLNQTPLNLHCRRRNASTVIARLLIDANPGAIHVLDGENGWGPLHHAAAQNNYDLIRLLIDADAESARLRTNPGMETPLHKLCQKNVGDRHMPAMKILLRTFPKAVITRDALKNHTPLHLVARQARVPCSVVQSLIDGMPEAASIPDSNHYLPIHHACEVGADPAVISCLLKAHPPGAIIMTKKNDSALSLACACNKSTETVALLIEANPMALKEKNDYGFTPLHNVCGALQPRMGIVQEILKVCPESFSTRSHGGETPVHIACGNPGTFVGVIELLTAQNEKNGDASAKKITNGNPQMMNKVGNTPLHYACFRGSPFEHIETLAMSNPQWVKCSNNAGYTALQIISKNGRINDRIITTFSRIGGPGIFAVVDMMGNTPLHSAMREETDLEALRCLIRAYPDALNMKTAYGDLPLHLACFRRVDPEVVREVALASNEPPLLTPNTAGQTPIGIALEEFQTVCKTSRACCVKSDYKPEQKRAFEVLATLVRILHYSPSSGEDDRDRTGSLVRACLSLHRRNVRLDPAFIRRALYLYPEEAKLLDKEGNLPLHIEASIPVEKMGLLSASLDGCCSGTCHTRIGLLRMLMEIYPDACKNRNASGEFPMGLMIQNGRQWDQGFALALRMFPQALHWSLGVNDKVLPHVLDKVSRECGAATLFELISSKPDMYFTMGSNKK